MKQAYRLKKIVRFSFLAALSLILVTLQARAQTNPLFIPPTLTGPTVEVLFEG